MKQRQNKEKKSAIQRKQSKYYQSFEDLCKTCLSITISSEQIDESIFDQKTKLLKEIYFFIRSSSAFSITDKQSNFFLLLFEKNIINDYEGKQILNIDFEKILWTHKEILYLSLKEFMNKIPEYLSFTLIYKLIMNLCNSYDERERIFLENYIFQLYNDYQDLKNDIRAAIAQNLSLGRCSSELLELIESISSSYAQPLKKCHRQFFKNFILPLHSHNKYPIFQPQLISLIFQYINF